MIQAKAYGVLSTLVAVVTTSASVAPVHEGENPLIIVPLIGAVPAFAVGVGMFTALLVRVIIITSSPKRLLTYNVAVTGLAMMGSGSTIISHQMSVGIAFWVGAAFGAAGVGIIEIAKSKFFGSLAEAFKAALNKSGTSGPT